MGLKKDLISAYEKNGIIGLKDAQQKVDANNKTKAEKIVKNIIDKKKFSDKQRDVISAVKASATVNEKNGITTYNINNELFDKVVGSGLSLKDLTFALAEGWQQGKTQKTFIIRHYNEAIIAGDNAFHIAAVRNSLKFLPVNDCSHLSCTDTTKTGALVTLQTTFNPEIRDDRPKLAALDMVSEIANFAEELLKDNNGHLDYKEAQDIEVAARKMIENRDYNAPYGCNDMRYMLEPHISDGQSKTMYAQISHTVIMGDITNQTQSQNCKEVLYNGTPLLSNGFSFPYDVTFTNPFTGQTVFAKSNDMVLINSNGEFITGVKYDEFKTLESTDKLPIECEKEIKSHTHINIIKNIADYVKAGIESGTMFPMEFAKTARISAIQGVVGQEVITKMSNGLDETKNTVKLDEETGEPGWIVTNPAGEQYIVEDSVFRKKYEIDPQNPTLYKPKGAPVNCVVVGENIAFKAPWGEDMNIAANGILVLSGKNDIYGIQASEFAATYGPTDKDGLASLKESIELLGSEKTPEEIMRFATRHYQETEIKKDSLDQDLENLSNDKDTQNNEDIQNKNNDENDDHDNH